MNKFNNMIEQVLLLGLIPILGGSRNIQTAVITTIILILTAVILRIFSRIINIENLAGAHWILFLSIGISLTYSSYLFTAYLYPEVFQFSSMYLLLIGVTPLTYYGCKSEVTIADLWKRFNIFFIVIIIVSFFRELIGFGAILGRTFFEVGFAPLSTFQKAPGAFIILGTIWILIRFAIAKNIIDKSMFELEEAAGNE